MQDEVKALQLCQNKVRQKKLPMEVIDAEYQWWVSFLLFYYHPCLLIPVEGTDVNSLFTSLPTSGSIFESWYGNCSGAHSVSPLLPGTDYSSAHVGCIKRGSGWHPYRVLLASSSDIISSSRPSETPMSLKFPPSFSDTLLHFPFVPSAYFFYFRALINACFVRCRPSCMNFGVIFHP